MAIGSAAGSAEERAQLLVNHYEQELKKHQDRTRAGRLHFECARLYEHPLQNLAKATEHYGKAQSALPDHLPTVRGARRVLLAAQNFQQAALLFDAEAKLTSDNTRKAALLRGKGLLLEDRVRTRKNAVHALAQASQLDPGNPSWLKPLALALLQEESWSDLEQTYDKAANAVEKDQRHRAALVSERARLFEAHHKNFEQATELYQGALVHDSHAPGAIQALKQLDYGQKRWRDLVRVLEHEVKQAAEPEVRSLALYRIGRIEVDRLGNLEMGLAAMERASRETPEDTLVLGELARLYELSRNHAGLANVLERLVEHTATPAEKVGLLHRIGQLHERHLDDEQTAIAWYARALASNPSFSPVLQALERLYTKREQWQPLIGTLFNAANATQDPPGRAAIHAKIAELYEAQLNDAERAIEHHSQALGVAPGYETSFKALSRIYERLGRFRELIELHERGVEQESEVVAQVAHLFKIGLYLEDALKVPDRAIEAYKRILKLDPHNLGAIYAWQRAAERAHDWAELVRALEAEAQESGSKEHTANLLHRAGEVLAEHLDDTEGALERYRKVLGLVPKHRAAMANMGTLFEAAGRWDDLLDTYRRELRITPPGPTAAALRCKMAELCEEKLARDEQALELYREAVEAMPGHRLARRGLERKLAALGKWADLVKMLEHALAVTDDATEKASLGERIGEIYENRLEEAGKALAAYDHALKVKADFRPALDGRTRLLAQARSFTRLADELAREATSSSDPHLVIGARFREGQIRRDELNDPPGATRAFEDVLKTDPKHLGALLALEALYARQGLWDKLAANYVTQSQVLTDPKARVAVLHQLAHVQATRDLAEPSVLRQTYFAILQIEQGDIAALTALEELCLAESDTQLLAQVDAKLAAIVGEPELSSAYQARLGEALEGTNVGSALEVYRSALAREPDNHAAAHGLARIAERQHDAALLEEAAEHQSRVAGDQTAAAGLLVKAARVALASEVARAVKALQRALEIDPDHELAATHLHRILIESGDVTPLIDTLTQAAQKSRTRERRSDLWVLVAGLYAEQKQDIPAGMTALRRVIAEDATHVPALMKLAELCIRDSQWEPAANHLNDVLRQSADPSVRIDARLRLAALYDEHLKQPERALQSVNAVLRDNADHREALLRLLTVHLHTGENAAAAEAAERLMATANTPRTRAEAQVTLAQVERARGNPTNAMQHLEDSVAVLGLAGRGASELKALLSERRTHGQPPNWRGYVGALERYIEHSPRDPKLLTPVYLEVARALADELRQNDGALKVLDQALALAPTSPELHAERGLRLEHAGDLNGATDAWRRVLELKVTSPEPWRALSKVLTRMGRQADAALAVAPLVALGAATDGEQSQVASLPVRAGMAPAGSFTAEDFQGIDPLRGTDPAEVMLSLLGEVLPKIVPNDLARLGLSTRDRITARSGHPLRLLTDRVAAIFGLPDYHLYIQEVHSGSLEVELTEPLSIIVPAYLVNLTEAQQVFLVSRVIANAVRRLSAVDRLAPHELEMLLVSTAHALGYDMRSGLDSFSVEEQSRRIGRVLPRRTRRSIEEVVTPFATNPPTDFASWAALVRTAAARAALIISDELPGSIALVRRLEGDLAGLQGEARERGIKLAEDLLRFWVSEPAFLLRRQMGLM